MLFNHQNRPFTLSFIGIIFFGFASVALLFLQLDPQTRLLLSDIQAPLISLGALVALFWATYRTSQNSPEYTRVWLFLGIAQVFYFAGDLIWAIFELVLHINPYPSICDVLYLLYYPFIFVAISQYPVRNFKSTDWLKRVLDLVSILLGGLPIYWNYILGPIIQANEGLGFWDQLLAYAYPMGDLVLLGAILLLFYNRVREREQAPIILVAFGVLAMVFSDSAFSIQNLSGSYTAGGWSDFGFIIQNLLVWTAGVWQIMVVRKVTDTKKINMTVLDMMSGLFSYLPLLWYLGLTFVLLDSHLRVLPMTFEQVFSLTIAIWLIVFIRQIVTNMDITRLLKRIDDYVNMVKRQSTDLESANAGLEEEMAMRVEADQEREKMEDQLRHDALHDYLTHLPNRALLLDRLEMAIARTKRTQIPYSVMILDLDEFKQINDTKGHIAGDDILVRVADRLKNCVRVNDTVARLGGDEFIILLENTDDDKAIFATSDRILEEFKIPFELKDGMNIFLSVSIGVVTNISDYENSGDVLRDADIAMYYAKEKGKSRYEVFKPEMRARTIQRVMIESELRYAIEHSEFFLQYQPVFSLSTNALKGFEALIRWNNPRLGMQPPGMFIPVAEESGLIIEIGSWVLQEACRQLKAWHEQFPLLKHLAVNVNISGKQFAQPEFIERLQNVLNATGLNADALKLEITESLLLDSRLRESDLFNILRQMGVHLQIDDFGTGYSSLSYIQHIPVDVIKIDRSFVKELENGDKNADLIHAIVRMAHSLNMETTAEGIETWPQKETLAEMECDYGQGFLLAKPMDAVKIEEYLAGEEKEFLESDPQVK
jgi:diguanylate cyclase (GGDEF)-like protein